MPAALPRTGRHPAQLWDEILAFSLASCSWNAGWRVDQAWELMDLPCGGEHSVNSLYQDPDGTVWVGTAHGVIRYRGYAIEELIGNVSFAQMIWLMTRGELPGREEHAEDDEHRRPGRGAQLHHP